MNLSLLPTCGTKFYKYAVEWKKLYSEDLTPYEKEKIVGSLRKAIEAAGFKAEKVWGEQIEDRGSQITFSALGQQAPLDEKDKWDPDFSKRKKIKAILDPVILEFSVQMGGATSKFRSVNETSRTGLKRSTLDATRFEPENENEKVATAWARRVGFK